ncbi:MAG: uroporphyrinogen decarboxylase family protein [Verrucomicrobiales bacterium]|jgi:uroporphyrinogen decarboxylase|nr:uroporphyrinogen decarboxylase family protein [Verrucomicrobiales bacterium]
MTSRERVLTALSHRQPDRVPFALGFGPTGELAVTLEQYCAAQGVHWQRLAAAVVDKIIVHTPYCGPLTVTDPNLSTELFGIKTKTADYGGGRYEEFTDFPLAGVQDAAELEQYPWPDPTQFDYPGLREVILRDNPRREKAVQIWGGDPFELYTWMTGIEETMMNLAAEPDLARTALTFITDFLVAKLERVLAAAGDLLDIIFIGDDLGGQTGLLFSRETYRDVIQPSHRRLALTVKKLAPHAKVMFHTDGAVFDVVPDLLDAGVDILEAVQTDAAGMEPERLKAAYGDRLSFHGGISVQHLLPHGDPLTVSRECQRLVEIFGADGGYIAAPAHAIQVGTPPENVFAMLRAVLGEGVFERCLAVARG